MTPQLAETAKRWGLLACGSSGHWQMDLDESLDGREWSLQIDGPRTFLRLAVADLEIIRTLWAYLNEPAHTESNDGLPLGRLGSATVSVIQDDEFATRWFIRIDGEAGAVLRVTLEEGDAQAIADALAQLMQQVG